MYHQKNAHLTEGSKASSSLSQVLEIVWSCWFGFSALMGQLLCHLLALIAVRLKQTVSLKKPSSAWQLLFCLSGWHQGELSGAGTQLRVSAISPVLLPAFPWHIPCAWGSGRARGALGELARVWQEPLCCSRQSGPVAAPTAASAQEQRGRMSFSLKSGITHSIWELSDDTSF